MAEGNKGCHRRRRHAPGRPRRAHRAASGALLGTASFPDARGYASMVAWMRAFGRVEAAASRHGRLRRRARPRARRRGRPRARGLAPDRSERRRRGKSDGIDAEQAARAALAGTRCARRVALRRDGRPRRARGGLRRRGEGEDGGARRPLQARSSLPEEARAPLLRGRAPRAAGACASMRPGAGSSPRPWPRSPCFARPAARARRGGEEARGRDRRSRGARPSTGRSSGRAHASPRRRLLLAAGLNLACAQASFSMLCGARPCPSRAAE